MDVAFHRMMESNPALAHCTIRVDEDTKKGAVIDVVRWMTGLTGKLASQCAARLPLELTSKFDHIRINGKGKITPVADASTLVEIVWDLPGKAAKAFKRQSAHLVARYLGADRTLIDEIETRYERVPTENQEFLKANTERPDMGPLSDDERTRLIKRKREDLELAELDDKLKVRGDNAKEQTLGHQNRMEALGAERVLTRTRLVANPEIALLIKSDAHIQSVFNNYLKQSMLFLTYDR